jgi:NAD(P)-dependent dehydrogenase (short-subunit alcohol dehydrogenase family)
MVKGKIAIITGATSGIGEATTKLFIQNHAKVFLTGRNEEKLKSLQKEFGNDRVGILAGNITDSQFREKLVNSCLETFGDIDILVNSAGIIGTGTIENTSLDDFKAMMDINVYSVFHLIQLVTPFLKKRKGSVVNVSSVTGIRAFPGVLAYCVSKAAVDQLTRVVALELAPYQVRVNAVNPGVVVTNLHKRGGMDEKTYVEFLEKSKLTHPLGRVGQPEDVAEAILYLASERSGWVTGVSLPVDGGRAQTCLR